MPGIEQRRVTQRIDVQGLQGSARIGVNAQPSNALGDISGKSITHASWDGKAEQDSIALSFLSRSLGQAQQAAEGVIEQRQKQGQAAGAQAFLEGKKYEDMKRRGEQDGYLAAKGAQVAETIRRDLLTAVELGKMTPEEARASVKDKLKGLTGEGEEAPFVNAALPKIVNGIQEFDNVYATKQLREVKQEQINTLRANIGSLMDQHGVLPDKEWNAQRDEYRKLAKAQGLTQEWNATEFDLAVTKARINKDTSLLERITASRSDGIPSLADSVEGGRAKILETYEAIDRQNKQDEAEREHLERKAGEDFVDAKDKELAKLSPDALKDFIAGADSDPEFSKLPFEVRHKVLGIARARRQEQLGFKDEEARDNSEKLYRDILLGKTNPTKSDLQAQLAAGAISYGAYEKITASRDSDAEPIMRTVLQDAMADVQITNKEEGGKQFVSVTVMKDGKPVTGQFERSEWSLMQTNAAKRMHEAAESGQYDFKKDPAGSMLAMRQIVADEFGRKGVYLSMDAAKLDSKEFAPPPEQVKEMSVDAWNAYPEPVRAAYAAKLKPTDLVRLPSAIKDPAIVVDLRKRVLRQQAQATRDALNASAEKVFIKKEAERLKEEAADRKLHEIVKEQRTLNSLQSRWGRPSAPTDPLTRLIEAHLEGASK